MTAAANPNPADQNPNPGQAGYRLDPPVDFDKLVKQKHADTARRLAYVLVGILAGSILLHYGCVMALILLKRQEDVKTLEQLFNSLLPVISGLASAAATYYFTKEGK